MNKKSPEGGGGFNPRKSKQKRLGFSPGPFFLPIEGTH